MDYTKELLEIKDMLEKEYGYDIVYIAVQGSNNYNLDIHNDKYESDLDAKAFILPSFDDLYNGYKVSKTYTTTYGIVDVKDIRIIPELLGKMNSSFLEVFATPYYIINTNIDTNSYINQIRNMLEKLIEERKPLLYKTIMDSISNKQNQIWSSSGDYDKKELQYIYRLLFIMEDTEAGSNYGSTLWLTGFKRQFLIGVKTDGIGNIEFAKSEVDKIMEKANNIYNLYWRNKSPLQPIEDKTLGIINNIMFELVYQNLSILKLRKNKDK